ncbi:hypothetical protein [Streptomyces sp. NPDC059949]|uniref:hypothetical protein n=1 Tax=Streptomyces sp. NPDC059949 TaxID=3347013 RepID=UPI003656682B
MPGTAVGPRWLINKWIARPASDWLIVIVILSLHLAWVHWTGGGDLLGKPGREQRLEMYTTGATVVAVTGSFITAAIAQYVAAKGRRMRALRTAGHLGSQFRRNWVSIMSATLLVAGVCLLATVLDVTERDPGGVHWMVEAAFILCVARSYRLLWLLNAVILATDRDLAESTPDARRPST